MGRGSPSSKPPDGLLPHVSYSALSTALECWKALQLGRIQKAPQSQAWWFAGGSAVHAATEVYDRDFVEVGDHWDAVTVKSVWAERFEEEIEKTKEKEPDDTKWRAGNEKYKEWNTSGPAQVQAYIDWRRRSPYVLWTTPDGEPAIELEISGYLPGCGLEIKAYLDRVFIDPHIDMMAVVDLKSGKTKPSGPLQFGTYGALMIQKYNAHPSWGAALMTRDGALHKPWPLGKYTPEYMGKQFGAMERIVAAGAFPANVGGHCFSCGVKDACFAQDGPLAERYDPDSPGYAPPF